MKKMSLTVVGFGIKLLSHLSTETRAHIEQSDKVLYLVNEPLMQEWIAKNSKSSENLDDLYQKYPLRKQCYQAITEHILETLKTGIVLCVVTYGHPTVFAQPLLEAVVRAQAEGLDAKILPAISAEDCLFTDLLINPGDLGCASFESTDFMLYRRQWDASSHLILWQVGVIGLLSQPRPEFDNRRGAELLMKYLNQKYALNHPVVLYEAAQYPYFEPRIERCTLSQLPELNYSAIATLYVPPAHKAQRDDSVLEYLGVPIPPSS